METSSRTSDNPQLPGYQRKEHKGRCSKEDIEQNRLAQRSANMNDDGCICHTAESAPTRYPRITIIITLLLSFPPPPEPQASFPPIDIQIHIQRSMLTLTVYRRPTRALATRWPAVARWVDRSSTDLRW